MLAAATAYLSSQLSVPDVHEQAACAMRSVCGRRQLHRDLSSTDFVAEKAPAFPVVSGTLGNWPSADAERIVDSFWAQLVSIPELPENERAGVAENIARWLTAANSGLAVGAITPCELQSFEADSEGKGKGAAQLLGMDGEARRQLLAALVAALDQLVGVHGEGVLKELLLAAGTGSAPGSKGLRKRRRGGDLVLLEAVAAEQVDADAATVRAQLIELGDAEKEKIVGAAV